MEREKILMKRRLCKEQCESLFKVLGFLIASLSPSVLTNKTLLEELTKIFKDVKKMRAILNSSTPANIKTLIPSLSSAQEAMAKSVKMLRTILRWYEVNLGRSAGIVQEIRSVKQSVEKIDEMLNELLTMLSNFSEERIPTIYQEDQPLPKPVKLGMVFLALTVAALLLLYAWRFFGV